MGYIEHRVRHDIFQTWISMSYIDTVIAEYWGLCSVHRPGRQQVTADKLSSVIIKAKTNIQPQYIITQESLNFNRILLKALI